MAVFVSVLASKLEADQWLLMAEALLQRLGMEGGAQLVANVELASCTIFATSLEVWVKTLKSAWLAWLFLCPLAFVVAKSSALVAATMLVLVYLAEQLVFVRMVAVLVAARWSWVDQLEWGADILTDILAMYATRPAGSPGRIDLCDLPKVVGLTRLAESGT